jgi:anthranilate 1,2-dioxygenase large subunit
MAWLKVATLGEIGDGVFGVKVDDVHLALYNLSGEIYATDGICTHALALLSEGWIEDGKIECPLHQGMFDIRTGKALCTPVTEDIRTYAVKVEGDEVFVNLDQPAATTSVASGTT